MEQESPTKIQSKLPVWIFGGIAVSLWIGLKSCAGAETWGLHNATPPLSAEDRQKSYELRHSFPRNSGRANSWEADTNHVSVVTDGLLDLVAWKESHNNPRARGKQGEMGLYQLKAIAIREVNRVYNTSYRSIDAWDPIRAREIARRYLLICESRCTVKTPSAVYAKYRGR